MVPNHADWAIAPRILVLFSCTIARYQIDLIRLREALRVFVPLNWIYYSLKKGRFREVR